MNQIQTQDFTMTVLLGLLTALLDWLWFRMLGMLHWEDSPIPFVLCTSFL